MKGLCVLTVLLGSTAAIAPPGTAYAQTTMTSDASQGQSAPVSTSDQTAQSSNAQVGFGDIVVTAQKRVENLQDVPISISALSADQLASKGIVSIDGITTLPNVKFGRSAASKTAAQIAMRGSVTINASVLWEPAVGMYMDGIYISKVQGAIFDVADLERVEVLRGPQGTLYGRNTLAGAVNLITKKPTGEFGGSAEISYGNYNYMRAKFSVDLPQFSIFSVKLAGQVTRRDGFIKLTGSPYPDTDNLNNESFLAQVHADFSDHLTADYTYNYNHVNERPPFGQLYSVNSNGDPRDIFDPNSPGYAFGGAAFPLDKFIDTTRQSSGSINTRTYERSKMNGQALILTLDLGAAKLKSLTSYRTLKWGDKLDLDGTAYPVAQTQRITDYDGFSQELQLSGQAFDDRLNYVAGLFYFKEKAETLGPQTFFGGGASYESDYGSHTDAYAAYAQADYKIIDALTLTLGGRFTHEKKDVRRYLQAADASTGFVPVVVADFPYGIFSTTYNNFSPAATLGYKMSKDINVYARYAQGYKSGGYNGETNAFGAVTADCPSGATELCNPYGAEKVYSYEVGFKTRLLDRRLVLNVSAFHDIHKGLQVAVFQGTGAVASTVQNAASATINGVEVEADIMPIEALTFNTSFSYLDPSYGSYFDRGLQVADNRAFAHAPKYTASFAADWRVAEQSWGRLDLSGDVSYMSSYYTAPVALAQPSPADADYGYWAKDTQAPSHIFVNVRAAVTNMKLGTMDAEVSIWGKNVFNENRPTNFIDFGPGFGGLRVAYFPDPATYGGTIKFKF